MGLEQVKFADILILRLFCNKFASTKRTTGSALIIASEGQIQALEFSYQVMNKKLHGQLFKRK